MEERKKDDMRKDGGKVERKDEGRGGRERMEGRDDGGKEGNGGKKWRE